MDRIDYKSVTNMFSKEYFGSSTIEEFAWMPWIRSLFFLSHFNYFLFKRREGGGVQTSCHDKTMILEGCPLQHALTKKTPWTFTPPFMVFNVMYTICKGPILDAYRSLSVTSANCNIILFVMHKCFFKVKNYSHYDIYLSMLGNLRW
jgi:hypothetical protein